MKELLLLISLLSCISFSNAQDINTNKKSYIYCEILGTGKFMSNKVTISLDFGQFNKLTSNQSLVDENGKPVVFNSMVDAMNWMGKDGWEFMQAYVIKTQYAHVYHWLLKLDLDTLTPQEREEVLSKLQTRDMYKLKEKEEKGGN